MGPVKWKVENGELMGLEFAKRKAQPHCQCPFGPLGRLSPFQPGNTK